jgi:hypothetical protein
MHIVASNDHADRVDTIDTITNRLHQVTGVLTAIRNTYDTGMGDFNLPADYMANALWAINELVDQASELVEKLD